MNVIVPPVFDSVLFPDGKRYIPFADNYTFTPTAITGLDWSSINLSAIRDYRLCKLLSSSIQLAGDDGIWLGNQTYSTSGTYYQFEVVINTGSATVGLRRWVVVYSGSTTPVQRVVTITGWTPIS